MLRQPIAERWKLQLKILWNLSEQSSDCGTNQESPGRLHSTGLPTRLLQLKHVNVTKVFHNEEDIQFW